MSDNISDSDSEIYMKIPFDQSLGAERGLCRWSDLKYMSSLSPNRQVPVRETLEHNREPHSSFRAGILTEFK